MELPEAAEERSTAFSKPTDVFSSLMDFDQLSKVPVTMTSEGSTEFLKVQKNKPMRRLKNRRARGAKGRMRREVYMEVVSFAKSREDSPPGVTGYAGKSRRSQRRPEGKKPLPQQPNTQVKPFTCGRGAQAQNRIGTQICSCGCGCGCDGDGDGRRMGREWGFDAAGTALNRPLPTRGRRGRA